MLMSAIYVARRVAKATRFTSPNTATHTVKDVIAKGGGLKMADAESCCCGAGKSNPCACMKKMAKTGGKMQCSSKEPMCPCYKDLKKEGKHPADLKKAFDTAWEISIW